MSKKLVAYFSATGITKKVAVKLAEYIDADLRMKILKMKLHIECSF